MLNRAAIVGRPLVKRKQICRHDTSKAKLGILAPGPPQPGPAPADERCVKEAEHKTAKRAMEGNGFDDMRRRSDQERKERLTKQPSSGLSG